VHPVRSSADQEVALLRVREVTVRFGGVVALNTLSFDIERGTICALIGPNGAGKTTLLNCLSRLYDCESGEIEFGGTGVKALEPHRVPMLGIGRTFQNLALFRSMTVWDNVMVGAHCRTRSGFFASALRLPFVQREEQEMAARAHEVLAFLDLERLGGTRVADLPFGTQKRVELARALAGKPKLLLLDEPACGLNHEEVSALGARIRAIRDRLGVTVLLIEHHMGLVMSICDRVVVLNFGRKIAEGSPDEIRRHPEVIHAYLGGA